MEESAVFLHRPVATKAGMRDCVWPRLAVLGFFWRPDNLELENPSDFQGSF